MKKILIIILALLIMVIIISKKEYNLTEDAIRFRVIANSNSSKDILIKQIVVNELSKILFKKNNNIEDMREEIINNIENIQDTIDTIFIKNNYNLPYNINYGLNYFPEKEYNGKKFKEGNYESLVIEIGESKGNNYWCILYPPLCMVDDNFDNKEIKYKFKVAEILEKLF